MEVYGRPEAIRLDNGPELTADAFVDWAEEHGVKLLFIQPGKPNQNAFIERFNRSFRQEVLDAWLFNAISEVQDAADAWLTDYNEYRPHDSLGNMPPALWVSFTSAATRWTRSFRRCTRSASNSGHKPNKHSEKATTRKLPNWMGASGNG